MSGGRSLFFRAFSGSEAHASIDTEDDEKAILESADLRVEVNLRGGGAHIFPGGARDRIGHVSANLGPPFGGSWMRPPLYAARVEQTLQGTKLILTIPSRERPGLILECGFSMVSGGVLRIEDRVLNTTDQALPCKLRLGASTERNESLALCTPCGLIREPVRNWGEFPSGDTDLLAHGASLTESWIATEGKGTDGKREVCGLIWQGGPAQEMAWSFFPDLTYDLGEIPPHADTVVPAHFFVAAGGDWQVVRNWWRRLAQPAGYAEKEKLEPKRVLELAVEPAPALLRQARESVGLALFNRRGTPLNGRVILKGDLFQAGPEQHALLGVDRDHPYHAQVNLCAPETPAAGFLRAEIDSGVWTEQRKLPLVRLTGAGQVEIAQPEPERVVLDNGYFTLTFAPNFMGALTGLETGGVNHLLSAFPEARPFIWMNPWFGGVHPFNNWMGSPDLARETFTGGMIERTGERGWKWQGVRMVCDLSHKDRSWMRVEMEYLTLPGSNALALVLRHTNRTNARMPQYVGVVAWIQPGGTRENATLHWERDGERRQRKRGGFAAEGESERWAAVENPATGDALLLIATDPAHNACWEDFGAEGPHIQARGPAHLGPSETQERLYWLVHVTDISQTDAYGAALSQARRLP